MEGPILGSRRGNHFLTEPPHQQSSMEEGTILWYGVVCGAWNGVGVLTWVQGIMNGEQYSEILDGGVVESFEKLEIVLLQLHFTQLNSTLPHSSGTAEAEWSEVIN